MYIYALYSTNVDMDIYDLTIIFSFFFLKKGHTWM